MCSQEVIQIKKLIKEGFDNKYIQSLYLQVNRETISNIRCNKTWKSVSI